MIHKYRQNGYDIALDVASGAVHLLDGCAFEVLDHYPDKSRDETIKLLSDKYPAAEILSCLDEIEALKNDGLLFSDDVCLTPEEYGAGERVVKALCIHVANDCNMRCRYCFAESAYGGDRKLMPLQTGLAAVDFLIKNSGNRKNLEIDFFGGEPLLNIETVKQITFYCKKKERENDKKFRFTLTTNGVLLNDETAVFINAYMDDVVLSLDGRKDVNDKMRVLPGGRGAYETVLPKFKRLVESRGNARYYIRGTFTRLNTDFAEDVKHLAELGFDRISIEPAVVPETEGFALKLTDADALRREYERLAEYLLADKRNGWHISFFHFNIDLEGGPCVKKRVSGCGAGSEYFAVTPDGKLYPCHRFAGMDLFLAGDVYGGLNNNRLTETFLNAGLYAKEDCKACWAKYYCGGGCAANAYFMNGDINKPYALGCALHKKRCECAIMLNAAGGAPL